MIVYTHKRRIPFQIDETDWDVVSQYKWAIAGDGYPTANVETDQFSTQAKTLHLFLLGPAPEGLEWDHVDRDRLNNQRGNLRAVTHTENVWNATPRYDNTSGFKGVSWYRKYGQWRVQISVDGRVRHVGYFDSIVEAAAAYADAAAKRQDRNQH